MQSRPTWSTVACRAVGIALAVLLVPAIAGAQTTPARRNVKDPLAIPTERLARAQAPVQNTAPKLRDRWEELSRMVASVGANEAAAEIEKSVNSLSDEQLEAVYGNADMAGMIEVFMIIEQALDHVDRTGGAPGGVPVRELIAESKYGGPALGRGAFESAVVPRSFGDFPDATGYPAKGYCPSSPDRSDDLALQIAVDAIQAARIALEAAKVIWSGLSRLCDQTVVVCPVPGGGNTSTLCIAADIVLFAAELAVGIAEGVVEHFEFCDSGVDSAEIEGTYERVGHLHTDLQTHDTGVKGVVETHDLDMKGLLGIHDGDVKGLLAGLLGAVADVQLGVAQNAALIIESSLAHGVCPAWMFTPAGLDGEPPDAYEGRLQQVIDIVQKTIEDARTMGCVKERRLKASQHLLDLVKAQVQAGLPLDCGRVCDHLRRAYKLATTHDGRCHGRHPGVDKP